MTIHQLRERSNAFVSNLETHVKAAVMANDKEIIAMNQEQMRIGKNAKGEQIGTLRSLSYARRKKDRGGIAPFGVVDLFDTGAFQSKMVLFTDGKTFYEIGSIDEKEAGLAAKYGQDIFGLMPTWQDDAQRLTSETLAELYSNLVLR